MHEGLEPQHMINVVRNWFIYSGHCNL